MGLFCWWIVALLLVLSYPASAAFWRHSKVLRLIFGILTIVPFSGACWRCAHYADNHYSGALWLLYVMIRCGARTLAPICLVKCLASTSWRRRSHRVKRQGFWRFADRGSDFYGVWAHLDVTPTVLLVCSVVAARLRCWAT